MKSGQNLESELKGHDGIFHINSVKETNSNYEYDQLPPVITKSFDKRNPIKTQSSNFLENEKVVDDKI